jgi:hypothetical protein
MIGFAPRNQRLAVDNAPYVGLCGGCMALA